MRLRRRTEPERELDAIADALRAAERELAAYEKAVAEAEQEESELPALRADEVLGLVSGADAERRCGEVEVKLAEARKGRDRQRAIVDELRRRATGLRQEIAQRGVAEAETEVVAEAAEIVKMRDELAAAERRHEQAEQRLARVRADARWAGSEFDPEIAAAARAEEKRYAEAVTWYARNPHADDQIPVELRERVAARRAELAAEHDERSARLRREAEQSWEEVGGEPPFVSRGPGELRPGEAFERLKR